MEIGSYEDDYGTKRKTFKVVVEDFDFLTPKARDNNESENLPRRARSLIWKSLMMTEIFPFRRQNGTR